MRDIVRTFSATGCVGQRVNALGQFETFTDALEGIYTARDATKKLRKLYGDPTIVINHVEPDTHTYRLSFSDFLKYASIDD
jgi:hypothetical protein